MIKLYFAPLEGITGRIFRNAYHRYFKGIDEYFAPFISPYGNCYITPKEKWDIDPLQNNLNSLVPQIIGNNPEYFAGTARVLNEMGYDHININIGCPSGTVFAKKKGAGLLADLELLDSFLDGIFNSPSLKGIRISVKTRIGVTEPDEFHKILEIYNKFPIYSLIIHPRLRKDMYKGSPRMESFLYACEHTKIPLVYNGDVNSLEDFKYIISTWGNVLAKMEDKKVDGTIDNKERIKINESMDMMKYNLHWSKRITGVMIGRGLLKNPWLAEEIENYLSTESVGNMICKSFITEDIEMDTYRNNKPGRSDFSKVSDAENDSNCKDEGSSCRVSTALKLSHKIDIDLFKAFHNEIYRNYQEVVSPDIHTLFRMKEIWSYWITMFPNKMKEYKLLLKSKYYTQYEAAVNSIIN